jgi:hypothetical protein
VLYGYLGCRLEISLIRNRIIAGFRAKYSVPLSSDKARKKLVI